jgi:hypothetical protein
MEDPEKLHRAPSCRSGRIRLDVNKMACFDNAATSQRRETAVAWSKSNAGTASIPPTRLYVNAFVISMINNTPTHLLQDADAHRTCNQPYTITGLYCLVDTN